jgi:hypothetical protein
MYRKGHLRNSDTWRQVGRKASTPMFLTSAAERIAKWEAKQAEEKAAKETSK